MSDEELVYITAIVPESLRDKFEAEFIEECEKGYRDIFEIFVGKKIVELFEGNKAIEPQSFDFNTKWGSIGPETKRKFIKKVKQIEHDALNRISNNEKIDFTIITKNVTLLDPESEWESFEGCDELPADVNWIEFEMQFFKEELVEKGIL